MWCSGPVGMTWYDKTRGTCITSACSYTPANLHDEAEGERMSIVTSDSISAKMRWLATVRVGLDERNG